MTATFERIPVDRIAPHDSNVRTDLGDLGELAASIKGMGVLQPLTVAPVLITQQEQAASSALLPQRYVLIAGHRRHAAAVKAGLPSVPCIVRDDLDTPAKQLQAMLVENLQRSDLTVMEEADAYAQLELLGVKEAAIAKTTGRSKATVHQRLQLASLPAQRRQQVADGKLTIEAGVQCARLRAEYADDEEILALVDKAPTWKFGSDYGLKYDIQRVLDQRNAPAQDDQDEEDTIDYAGKRAAREAEWEKRQAEQRAERERVAAIWRSHNGWIGGLVARARSDENTRFDIADAVFREMVDDQNLDEDVLPALAIEVSDAGDPIAWTVTDALLYLLLHMAPIEFEPKGWGSPLWELRRRIRWMQSLGYSPTADDLAILEPAQDDE